MYCSDIDEQHRELTKRITYPVRKDRSWIWVRVIAIGDRRRRPGLCVLYCKPWEGHVSAP